MIQTDRRRFLQTAAGSLAAAWLVSGTPASAAERAKRRFTMDLAPGRIGVRADIREVIRLAHAYGFESVEPPAGYLQKLSAGETAELNDLMQSQSLVWGAAGLPVDFRRDDDRFQTSMKGLPQVAAALKRAGVSRVGTWLSPAHDSLTYAANFRQHALRLREAAKVLGDHGLSLGLEYVGPKTSWTARRYAFVHNMAQTKDLVAEIGLGNVGFVLDSWHWYTAGETAGDLLSLKNEQVVACDLNDAPAGVAVDEQIDNQRELPAATGVIDLKSFLAALVQIGYDGPVRAEPFNRELNALENEQAVEETAAAMKKAFALIQSAPK
jgi:sugar phosphate isomerase/epimerase